ncbi:MAG: hypothetical protein ACK5VI_10215 [Opitutia bacterium]
MYDLDQLIEQRRGGVVAKPVPVLAAYEPRRWLAWHRGDPRTLEDIAVAVGRPVAVVDAAIRGVLEADAAAEARDRLCRSRRMSQPPQISMAPE